MGNIDNINPRAVVVRDDPTATAAVSAAPTAPQPSEEIICNLAAFLPKDQDDYVKVREDPKYYYVDIGRSKAVDEIYRPLHNRVSAIDHKYKASLQALLTQMLADQITNTNTAVNATPSKTRAVRKRPAPKSSSINKVVISRSKRNNTTTVSTSNGSIIASSSAGSKTHPFRSGTASKAQTTDDSISPSAIAGDIEQLQSYALELMSELSIDQNTTTQSASTTSKSVATTVPKKAKKNIASKKPFIANEESVLEPGIVILEESNASMPTGTVMKTRLRTRQATNTNSLANSATKAPITKARKVAACSVTPSSKATRMATSPKSLTNPKLNATPSKRVGIDLSATPSSLTSSRSRTSGGESSSNRQERLIMSVEKSKKAEEKKKALLDSRINALMSEREKRLGKIAENKKAIDHEKEAKFKAIVVTAPPSGPTGAMTKAEARNAERRFKLAQLEQKKVKQMALKAEADALTTSKGTNVKATTMKATKPAVKNQAKKGVAKKLQQLQPKPVVQKPIDDQRQHHDHQDDVSVSVMSPIAKLSGFNGKINETFTQQTELPNPTLTTPKTEVLMANSTFISAPETSSAAQPANDGTFVMPNAPPPDTPSGKGPATATFNLAKQAIQSQLNSTNNYEMTPPPVERTYDNNYDISQYVDSDDEEKQAELKADAKRNGGKHVPKWCLGKPFLSQVHAQFGMPPEQLAQWTQRLFPKPVLPVPLEDMGLNVRERYVQRSSSVNWKIAAEIESVLKKDKDSTM